MCSANINGFINASFESDRANCAIENDTSQQFEEVELQERVNENSRLPVVSKTDTKNKSDSPEETIDTIRNASERTGVVVEDPNKDEDIRESWDKPIEFLLSCISMSVGLGNVWRFPGVAARNGGGAFLIPYLIVLLLIGRPLYFLEMSIGQFSKSGQVKVWNMVPICKGIGFGTLVAAICCCSYYCALMAIAFYFFLCIWGEARLCTALFRKTCQYNYSSKVVFPQVDNLNNGLGEIHWTLVLCLVLSWFLVFLSVIRGVKSSGKVAYFTAIFPYIVLFILLGRGVTLKGAGSGVLYFITPKWNRLLDPKVWYAAVEQCLFSLGTGFGTIIHTSSFNTFGQNLYRDVLIITLLDTFTSLLAGCTIFSVMGYLVTVNNEIYGTNLTFESIKGGPSLAFVLYPQSIAEFSWAPPLFSILFFLMLVTLALGSVVPLVGSISTIITDEFPECKTWLLSLIICVLGCLAGLVYVTEGGMFMIDLIDHYGSGFVVYIMAMLECIGVAWVYGIPSISQDIEFMLGKKVGVYWKMCWGIVIPLGTIFNLVYYLVTEPEFKSNEISYPKAAMYGGWMLTAFAISMLPVCAIYTVGKMEGNNLWEKIRNSFRPTGRWGPQQTVRRQQWLEFKNELENGD